MKLKISGLSKSFGHHQVLDQLSLELDGAHRFVIIGPSGGGKTTLLRVLAGLEIPDAGEVALNGERMQFQEAALHRHRLGMGIVFQAYNLFPHLTALQNITLPLEKVHGHSPSAAQEIAVQLLRRFQLDTHAAKKPAELSGGQRQRVAIARAVADRVAFLSDGHILECGDAEQIFTSPTTVQCRRFMDMVLKY